MKCIYDSSMELLLYIRRSSQSHVSNLPYTVTPRVYVHLITTVCFPLPFSVTARDVSSPMCMPSEHDASRITHDSVVCIQNDYDYDG